MKIIEKIFGFLFNEKGRIMICRDPDPDPNAGGGGGDEDPDPSADGDDGGGSPEWLNSLPEEARKDPNVTKYKTVEEFYNGYKHQASLLGKKGVIVPGENASEQERNQFYNSLGRPEKPDGYKFDTIEDLHQSIKVTPEAQASFAKAMHELGLSNAHANGVNKFCMKILSDAQKAQDKMEQEAAEKAETALRGEWGSDYDAKSSAVIKGITRVGGQEAIDAMGGEKGIGNNPVVLKMMSKLFGLLSEDQLNTVTAQTPAQGSHGNESKEEAIAKLKKFDDPESEENKALYDERNPKHSEVVKERMRLYNIAFPDAGE